LFLNPIVCAALSLLNLFLEDALRLRSQLALCEILYVTLGPSAILFLAFENWEKQHNMEPGFSSLSFFQPFHAARLCREPLNK